MATASNTAIGYTYPSTARSASGYCGLTMKQQQPATRADRKR